MDDIDNAYEWAERLGLFCKHGVYLGDANPNRPCPECNPESETDDG